MDRDRVSLKQLCAAAFSGLFSPISRLLPKQSLRLAGTSCMAAPVLAMLPLTLLMLLVWQIMRRRKENEGLADIMENSFGKTLGRGILLVYGLWILIYASFVLRSGVERLLSTAYPTGRELPFLAAMAAMSALAARGNVRSAVRCSVILSIMFCGVLAIVYGAALPNVKAEYIWPVNPMQYDKILLSALPVVNVISPWAYFAFLGGYLKPEKHPLKQGIKLHAAILVSLMLFFVCTVGIVGPHLSARQQFPVFAMIRNLMVFNVIERIEALVVAMWMSADFIFITLLLICAGEIFRHIFTAADRRRLLLPCVSVMSVSALALAPNAFVFVKISEEIVPAVNLGMVFGGLSLTAAVQGIKGKIMEKKTQKGD